MKATIDLPLKLRGRYKLEAVDVFTGRRRLLADWFDNLITDNGLDLLGTTGNFQTYCLVGSGNTAPANSNTALVTFVASTSSTTNSLNTNSGSSPYFGTMTRTWRFAIGTATGNLSEIGIGPNSTNTGLFSRALILDGGGSPTTITVLSTEALDATYQLQVYAPLTDVTGNVTINAVSYAYVMRAANANSSGSWGGPNAANGDRMGLNGLTVYNGSIGSITSQPGGSSGNNGGIAVQSYTPGSLFIDSIVSFGLSDGNVSGGISAALLTYGRNFSSLGSFQVSFTPALPKDGSHTMTLTFRQSWARH
jgi:hypothetical protein